MHGTLLLTLTQPSSSECLSVCNSQTLVRHLVTLASLNNVVSFGPLADGFVTRQDWSGGTITVDQRTSRRWVLARRSGGAEKCTGIGARGYLRTLYRDLSPWRYGFASHG